MKLKPLGKTGVETFDYAFNPADGCTNGCPYCAAKRIVENFIRKGTKFTDFHYRPDVLERLDVSPDHKSYFFFNGDMFCRGFDKDYRTKLPENITDEDVQNIPLNCIMGTTVTGNQDLKKLEILANIFHDFDNRLYAHFEPLYNEVFPWGYLQQPFKERFLKKYIWWIVGCQTNPTIQPPQEAVAQIASYARYLRIALWEKNALDVGLPDKIQEKP